jgi:hypothetical protein
MNARDIDTSTRNLQWVRNTQEFDSAKQTSAVQRDL